MRWYRFTDAIFAAGIAASEAASQIVRGTAASTASFAGAFGMVPNAAVIGGAGALMAEVWMTSVLMFLIMGLCDEHAGSVPAGAQPALIGAAVTALICTFGSVTGCGMNPARDLGPRLVTLLTGWGAAATTAWCAANALCHTATARSTLRIRCHASRRMLARRPAPSQLSSHWKVMGHSAAQPLHAIGTCTP